MMMSHLTLSALRQDLKGNLFAIFISKTGALV